ncbi:MAG: SurA N-terminal domain-containing protein [Rickettsiales bacterium]|jgi:hypothetical protein|nr:SurA N-terminal domain-containing protein [Rickettsiales bacterium]
MNGKKSENNSVKYLVVALLVVLVLSSINGILSVSNRYNIIVGKSKKLSINGFVGELNEEKRRLYSADMTDKELMYINSRELMVNLLDRIVDYDLFDLEVENFCIRKPDELVLKTISEGDLFKNDIDEGMTRLNDILKKENMTEEEYVEKIRKSDNLKYLLSTVSQTPLVNNLGIDIVFYENNLFKNAKIFSIDSDKLKNYSGEVSEDEVKKYYNNNIHKFVVPDTKKIVYVNLMEYLGAAPSKRKMDKLKSILSSSKNIEEFARAVDAKVEVFGYISREALVDDEKYAVIADVFDLAVNDLSWLKRVGNEIKVYSVVDVKNGYRKDIEKVREEIILAVQNEKTIKLREDIVQKYINDYRNNSSNDEDLISHGFSLKRINYISRNYQGYDENFIRQILTKETGEVTDIFYDKNTMYFAIVGRSGEFSAADENYASKDRVLVDTFNDVNGVILKNYAGYLRNTKYKIKVKYSLLDLIKLN